MRNLTLAAMLCIPLLAHAKTNLDEPAIAKIVRHFAPGSMARESAESPHEFPMQYDFATGRLDHSGKTYIVAAYTNSLHGRVRLLAPRADGSFKVAGEADGVGIGGLSTRVELIDVDGDGLPEIAASFSGDRGPSLQWILKWTGAKFIDLTPLEESDGVKLTALRSAVFVDIDGDGKLEIVNSAPRRRNSDDSSVPEDSFHVYKLHHGRFEDDGALVFYEEFIGGRSRRSSTFSVNRTDIGYTMTIVNGDVGGDNAVTAGTVKLNGNVIIDFADFHYHAASLSVHLARSNELEVTIDGPVRQGLLVTIRPDVPYVTKPLIPKAECVWADEVGSAFTASFGYDNPNPSPVIVEIGRDNFFSERSNRGQPARFVPGAHAGAFWVQSNGDTLTWTLNGTTVNATRTLPRCSGPEPVKRIWYVAPPK